MKMTLSAVAVAAVLTCGATGAGAQNVGGPAQPNWSGAYIGVQGGLGIADTSGSPGNPGAVEGTYSYSLEDLIAGGHVGWNFQSDNLVFGIEGDLEYSALDGRGTTTPIIATRDVLTDIDWMASLRARLGLVVDNLLVYTTGGVAFADVELGHAFVGAAPFHTFSETRVGWTGGIGVEAALWQDVTGRLEYRYTDFGNARDTNVPQFSVLDNDLEIHALRAGLSWAFPVLWP